MDDLTSKYVGRSGKWNPNLVFLENEIKNYRYLCLQGGTRSGKTFAANQFLWRQMDKHTGATYSMARETLTALKATTLRDFIDIGTQAGTYSEYYHNKAEKEYRYNGNLLDYFGGDDNEKVRGRKRDLLYLNEGPEIPWEIAKQLLWRSNYKVIIDYNPSYAESWIYDNILTRSDCALIITTFRDNPYLTPGQLSEIEWMRVNDPDSYKVYGDGLRGDIRGQVYSNWKRIKADVFPTEYTTVYVIDFGYSGDPACIAKFCKHNRSLYGQELVYNTGQDNIDLAIHLYFHGATANDVVIADSAESKSIGELRYGWGLELDYLKNKIEALGYDVADKIEEVQSALRQGFTVFGAIKGPDSINAGIQKVRQFEVFITEDSENAWKEYRLYKYPEDPHTGKLLTKPVDKNNHFCDTIRMFALAEDRYY